MTLLPAALTIVVIAIIGASLALAAFFWSLRNKQFSIKQLNEGANVIFDSDEPAGIATDQVFKEPPARTDERTPG